MGKGGWLGADRSVSMFAPLTAFESGVLQVTYSKRWLVFGCTGFIATDNCLITDRDRGNRVPANDLGCDDVIPTTASGFCLCDDKSAAGRERPGGVGFFVQCNHGISDLKCSDKCLEWIAKERALGRDQPDYVPTFAKEAVQQDAVNSFCTADGSNVALLTFQSELSDLPAVKFNPDTTFSNAGNTVVETHAALTDSAQTNGLPSYSIDTDGAIVVSTDPDRNPATQEDVKTTGLSHKGTRENLECSGRGACDEATGICACFDGFQSSDGNGNVGNRRDCGAVIKFPAAASAF
jgi:hypothetical protein